MDKKQKKPEKKKKTEEINLERFCERGLCSEQPPKCGAVQQWNCCTVFFPYLLLMRLWLFFSRLFAGSNMISLFVLLYNWAICKIDGCCNLDPVIYPFCFHLLIELMVLIGLVSVLWYFFGMYTLYPFLRSVLSVINIPLEESLSENRTKSVVFRRFCMKKAELFDATLGNGVINVRSSITVYVLAGITEYFLYKDLI